jgi:D-alanyl-D-alanine carboxypeptidase (penicillin-binding protein 5/6)
MKAWRLLGCWTSLAALLLGGPVGATSTPGDSNPFDRMGSAYLVEINGVPVWHKNAHQRLPPASLTKLMTALLVVQDLPPETGSKLGLRKGEILRARDLLAAMLMASANDACRALADHVGVNQQRFVYRMNRSAQNLGLRDTHFANACGHDAPDHFSSAADLQTLAHALLQNAQLAALVGQTQLQIATVDGARSFALRSSNALLGRYPGAQGIKTGNTPQAGKCMVALARRGPHTILLVLLGGRDRWWDAVDVLDIAFARADADAAL